jgi:hypothetical protein
VEGVVKMVLYMASKSVTLAISVSRRKNHLYNPLIFLSGNLLICLFILSVLACASHTYQLYDIYNVPQLRDQFLNPVLSRLLTIQARIRSIEIYHQEISVIKNVLLLTVSS